MEQSRVVVTLLDREWSVLPLKEGSPHGTEKMGPLGGVGAMWLVSKT